MTIARVQPFCNGCGVDVGDCYWNSERILPWTNKKKTLIVSIKKNHFCVIWESNRKTSWLDGIKEIEKNFRFEEFQIKDNLFKEVVE